MTPLQKFLAHAARLNEMANAMEATNAKRAAQHQQFLADMQKLADSIKALTAAFRPE